MFSSPLRSDLSEIHEPHEGSWERIRLLGEDQALSSSSMPEPHLSGLRCGATDPAWSLCSLPVSPFYIPAPRALLAALRADRKEGLSQPSSTTLV